MEIMLLKHCNAIILSVFTKASPGEYRSHMQSAHSRGNRCMKASIYCFLILVGEIILFT